MYVFILTWASRIGLMPKWFWWAWRTDTHDYGDGSDPFIHEPKDKRECLRYWWTHPTTGMLIRNIFYNRKREKRWGYDKWIPRWEAFCEKYIGHNIAWGDRGYGGGGFMDCHCAWCDKTLKVRRSEETGKDPWLDAMCDNLDEAQKNGEDLTI